MGGAGLPAATRARRSPEAPLGAAFIKLCLIALYIDACRTNQAARTFSTSYLPVQAVSAVLWAIGAFLEPQTAYWLWAAAVLIDLLVPSLFLTRRFRGMHVDTAHMPERFGLFTIIVLGEAILATVAGVHDVEFDFWSITAAIAGFPIAVAIWANYFNYVERAPLQCSLGNGNRYTMAHLPLVLGTIAAAVGVEHAIVEASHGHSEATTVWLLAGGALCWLLAFGTIQVSTYPASERLRIFASYAVAALGLAVLAAAVVALHATPAVAVIGTAVVLTVVAALDIHGRSTVPARAYIVRGRAGEAAARRGPKEYVGDGFVVSFDPAVCTHSGACLHSLPEVFDIGRRPWIRTDAASAEAIATVVAGCPTGALQFRMADVGAAATAAPAAVPPTGAVATDTAPDAGAGAGDDEPLIMPSPDGPLILHGRFEIVDRDGRLVKSGERTILCRCGRSQNKPFCDGSHRTADFEA